MMPAYIHRRKTLQMRAPPHMGGVSRNLSFKKLSRRSCAGQNALLDAPSPTQEGLPRCGRGGIGRRAALRSLWGNPWKFESSRPHQVLEKSADLSALFLVYGTMIFGVVLFTFAIQLSKRLLCKVPPFYAAGIGLACLGFRTVARLAF